MVETIKGLVRPFIAFCFVVGTVYLFVTGKLDANDILQMTGIIIGFYFGERAAKTKTVSNQ